MNLEYENNTSDDSSDVFTLKIKKLYKKIQNNNYSAIIGLIIVIIIPRLFNRHFDFDVIHQSSMFNLMILVIIAYMIYINIYLLRQINNATEENVKRFKRHASHMDLASFLMILLSILVLINTFFFSLAKVEGSSMYPTIEHQSDIVFEHIRQNYQRFDIVVVYIEEENYYLKRIIALPGEHVVIDQGLIYINGSLSPLNEPFRYGETSNCGLYCDFIVPQGHVFILGDNRENSVDSRVLGPISIDDIYGKVVFRIRPFKDIGTVE